MFKGIKIKLNSTIVWIILVFVIGLQGNSLNAQFDNYANTDSVDFSLIEKSLNIINFKQFLHFELQERNRLFFYSEIPIYPIYVKNLNLFSKNVTILTKNEFSNHKNVITLESVTRNGAKQNLHFVYKIEGIGINVLIESEKNGKYRIIKQNIYEKK